MDIEKCNDDEIILNPTKLSLGQIAKMPRDMISKAGLTRESFKRTKGLILWFQLPKHGMADMWIDIPLDLIPKMETYKWRCGLLSMEEIPLSTNIVISSLFGRNAWMSDYYHLFLFIYDLSYVYTKANYAFSVCI